MLPGHGSTSSTQWVMRQLLFWAPHPYWWWKILRIKRQHAPVSAVKTKNSYFGVNSLVQLFMIVPFKRVLLLNFYKKEHIRVCNPPSTCPTLSFYPERRQDRLEHLSSPRRSCPTRSQGWEARGRHTLTKANHLNHVANFAVLARAVHVSWPHLTPQGRFFQWK